MKRQTADVVHATVLVGRDGTFAISRLAFHFLRQTVGEKTNQRIDEGYNGFGEL